MTNNPTPLLSTRALKKVYQNQQQKTEVLTGLDLEIAEGEFTIIMGSSGSGKSTLLYLLSGLDKISDGEIWLKNQAIHQQSEKELAIMRRSDIGFVFQDANLVPNLTVWENILIAGYLGKASRQEIRNKAASLIKQTGLEGLEKRLPSQLSGGQQQRVAIIRALINKPRILMADEPTGNLNSASSTKVLDIFSDFHRKGQTILMVTHEVKSACRGNRILYFRDGKILDELTFDSTQDNLEKREAVLTQWLLEKGW